MVAQSCGGAGGLQMRMSVAVAANHLQKGARAAYSNGAVAAVVGGTRPVPYPDGGMVPRARPTGLRLRRKFPPLPVRSFRSSRDVSPGSATHASAR